MKRKQSADGVNGAFHFQELEDKQNSFDLHELLGLDNLSNRFEHNQKF